MDNTTLLINSHNDENEFVINIPLTSRSPTPNPKCVNNNRRNYTYLQDRSKTINKTSSTRKESLSSVYNDDDQTDMLLQQLRAQRRQSLQILKVNNPKTFKLAKPERLLKNQKGKNIPKLLLSSNKRTKNEKSAQSKQTKLNNVSVYVDNADGDTFPRHLPQPERLVKSSNVFNPNAWDMFFENGDEPTTVNTATDFSIFDRRNAITPKTRDAEYGSHSTENSPRGQRSGLESSFTHARTWNEGDFRYKLSNRIRGRICSSDNDIVRYSYEDFYVDTSHSSPNLQGPVRISNPIVCIHVYLFMFSRMSS